MQEDAWRIANNVKEGDACKEYYSVIYYCEPDDVWLVAESPRAK